MGYRTKALVLALFCLLQVSTLFTATANAVAKEEGEESHVVVGHDVNKGSRKVLNKKTMESVGEVTNDQDTQGLEDEKYGYRHSGHGGYGHGHGGYGHGGRSGYGHGGHSGYGHGHGGYGHGGHSGYGHGHGGYGHGGRSGYGHGGYGHGGHGG